MFKFLLVPILAGLLAWVPQVGSGYPKPAVSTLDANPDLTEYGIGNGRPLVIEYSPGGSVIAFAMKAGYLIFNKIPVIVDGPCMSACTILIDMDRANVCLTSNAVFGYHQAFYEDEEGTYHYFPIPFETPGLNKFLDAHGGEPADHLTILAVPFEFMKQFYRPCAGAM